MGRLYLFDSRAMNVASHLASAVAPPDVLHVSGPQESLVAMVAALSARLANAPAQGAVIVAHGNSGRLQLSADGLETGNAGALRPLRGRIRGTLRIHGCAVASAVRIRIVRTNSMNIAVEGATPGSLNTGWGPDVQSSLGGARALDGPTARMLRSGPGAGFLLALANTLSVWVTGAIQAQQPDRDWAYEGPTLTAFPLGPMQLHVPSGDTTFGSDTAGDYSVPF